MAKTNLVFNPDNPLDLACSCSRSPTAFRYVKSLLVCEFILCTGDYLLSISLLSLRKDPILEEVSQPHEPFIRLGRFLLNFSC